MKPAELRAALVATAQATERSGLTHGTSGNVSARIDGGMLITPTAIKYERLTPADIVEVRMDGLVVGNGLPSSEAPFHLAIYRARPEANAIVHAHSPYATALACARMEIPAFHYMVAVAGADRILCAPYATFGTPELANNAVMALMSRKACLLANHGQIAIGDTLDAAYDLVWEVETLAAQYWRVLQIGGPKLLDADEMGRVAAKFETYGKPAGAPAGDPRAAAEAFFNFAAVSKAKPEKASKGAVKSAKAAKPAKPVKKPAPLKKKAKR